MGLPKENDNKFGYDSGELIKQAKNMKPNSYYLVHGTFDDNVHYQHSLLFAKELEKSDILFRQQVIIIFDLILVIYIYKFSYLFLLSFRF